MDDDTADLTSRLGRPLGSYAELYPDLPARVAAILATRDPKIRRLLATVTRIERVRAEGRRAGVVARYGLTAAEARVALWLADGGDLKSLAAASRLSRGTLRAQLKAVFAKTGVNRQAALVKLVQAL